MKMKRRIFKKLYFVMKASKSRIRKRLRSYLTLITIASGRDIEIEVIVATAVVIIKPF